MTSNFVDLKLQQIFMLITIQISIRFQNFILEIIMINVELKIKELHQRKFERTILHRVLNNQNREFQSGIKTLANIDLLGNDTTFAVVTGQQLGFFGGPLYTVYKAITTCLVSDKVSLTSWI